MSCLWIDPLQLDLEAAKGPSRDSLLVLRQNHGSEIHFQRLAAALRTCPAEGKKIIDMTPFSRLGNQRAFRDSLLDPGLLASCWLLTSSPTLEQDLLAAFSRAKSSKCPRTIAYRKNGAALKVESGSEPRLEDLGLHGVPDDTGAGAYGSVRAAWFQVKSRPLVLGATLRAPDPRWSGDVQSIGDEQYFRMQNGMLVSHFVMMKALLRSVATVDQFAYEVAVHSCHGFSPKSEEAWPEVFIAANDNAFLIGAAAQRLTGIPCAVMDRVGLLPGRRLTKETISLDVAGKRAALIVDLSTTASELERAVSVLMNRRVVLANIVCAVWLECASPRFVDWFPFVPLCRPKRALGYVYRSAL